MVLVPGAADPVGPAGQGWAPLVPHGPSEAAAPGEATPRDDSEELPVEVGASPVCDIQSVHALGMGLG